VELCPFFNFTLLEHYGHNFTERIISKLMSLYDIYTTDKWADRTISTET
jgi:hypothetical protein